MSVLVPMTADEFSAFAADEIPAYAADKVASGQWTADEALDKSKQEFDGLLPQGLATPGHHLLSVHDETTAQRVGMIWFATQDRAGRAVAYVYNVRIDPAHQRRGHAARAFAALDEKVRELGLAGIALHVFGHNAGAHALYVKLGFAPTSITMFKAIPANIVTDPS